MTFTLDIWNINLDIEDTAIIVRKTKILRTEYCMSQADLK